jgi:hypothetical protein
MQKKFPGIHFLLEEEQNTIYVNDIDFYYSYTFEYYLDELVLNNTFDDMMKLYILPDRE